MIAISLLLHLILATQMPNLDAPVPEKPKPLTITLLEPPPPPAPEPVAPPPPEPPPPPPPKPVPVKTPSPPKPQVKPTEIAEPPPTNTPPAEAPSTPPVPAIIATEPVPDAPPPPVVVPPAPPPPKPTGPSQVDLDAARARYGSLLGSELARHKDYPHIARVRKWVGVVTVFLELDDQGRVLSSKIIESSGHNVLDKQALEMVAKSSFPPLPEVLKGSSFGVSIPISFDLKD
ncbi:energy transducer TonB [Pseudomethylobacillus aquaticus]|uniref:Energy transducer TonB n=1 Tax=Pseudomethylobacillus aquaticus TaxID=2676064 RepID=A0A3N0UUF1_9PROT|nr:energy transducer TonB [Pseudomethylobacillus aquaticus]ROH84095.1 energy transducer TonB [Pseudomethylobacillus aquaticus]